MSDSVEIAVVSGVEGPSIYINNYRVAGPKPWGGGKITQEWKAHKEDILRAIGASAKATDPMPCGHPQSEVVTSNEAPNYCAACLREALPTGAKFYEDRLGGEEGSLESLSFTELESNPALKGKFIATFGPTAFAEKKRQWVGACNLKFAQQGGEEGK